MMTVPREQAPAAHTTPPRYCPQCHAETEHWRGVVHGKWSYVCRTCWKMTPEGEPRDWRSDLLEDR